MGGPGMSSGSTASPRVGQAAFCSGSSSGGRAAPGMHSSCVEWSQCSCCGATSMQVCRAVAPDTVLGLGCAL
jgi:hypothetical protein